MEDNISKLYNALKAKGYTERHLGGSEENFRKRMSDKDNRKAFYDYVAGRKNFKIGSYDNYESMMSEPYQAKAEEPQEPVEQPQKPVMPQELKDSTIDTIPTFTESQLVAPSVSESLAVKSNIAAEHRAKADEKEREKQAKIEKRNDVLRKKLADNEKKLADIQKQIFEKTKAGGQQTVATPMGVTMTINTDKDIDLLQATARQIQRENDTLDAVINKGGAISALGDVFSDVGTYDFGASALGDTLKMRKIQKKLESGGKLSPVEEGLVQSFMNNTQAQASLDDDLGNMYRFGRIAGQSAPFMVDFLLTGGFSGLTRAGARGAARLVEKKGLEGAKAMAVKALGVSLDDAAKAAVMSNTIQAAKTLSGIEQERLGYADYKRDAEGNIITDAEGNPQYTFEGGKGIGESIYRGEMSSIIENFTEMAGTHFGGVGRALKSGAAKGLNKMGLSSITKAFQQAGSSNFAKSVSSALEKMGIQDLTGEILEEEIGIPLNALFLQDYPKSLDEFGKQQLDILGGIGLSVGFMQGVGLAGGGISRGLGYVAARNQLSKADKAGLKAFTGAEGEGTWYNIMDRLDISTNEELNNTLNDIMSTIVDPRQRAAVINYYNSLVNFRGYNLGAQAAQQDGAVTPEEEEQSNSFIEGGDIQDPQEMNDARLAMETAAQAVSPQIISDINESEDYFMQNVYPYLDNEQRTAVNSYLNARAKYEGMIDGVGTRIEEKVADAVADIDKKTDKTTNTIRVAYTKKGKKVYVTGGNLVIRDDGTIDYGASDKSVTIVEDGQEPRMVTPKDELEGAEQPINADEEKQSVSQTIEDEDSNAAANNIDGKIEYVAGKKYGITDANGNSFEVTIVQPIGQPSVVDANGNVTVSLNGSPVTLSSTDFQAMVDAYNLNRFNQQQAEQKEEQTEAQADIPVTSQYSPEDVVKLKIGNDIVSATVTHIADDGSGRIMLQGDAPIINGKTNVELTPEQFSSLLYTAEEEVADAQPVGETPSVETPQAPVEPQPAPVEPQPAPKKPLTQMSITDALNELYRKLKRDMKEVSAFIEANIAEKTKALEKETGKKPKMMTDLDAYVAKKDKWQEGIDALQAEIDFWNQVKVAHEKATNKPAVETPQVESIPSDEILDANDYIASLLGTSIRITPESFRRETGLKEEQKSLVGVIAGKDKGGVSIERAAEIIYESGDLQQYGFIGDDYDIRSIIIEILSEGNPRGYVKRRNEQRRRELEEASEEQRQRDAQERLGLDADTADEYEENFIPRMIQDYEGFDEDYFYSQIAEEYEREDDTETEIGEDATGNQAVQGEEPSEQEGTEGAEAGEQGGKVPVGDEVSGTDAAVAAAEEDVEEEPTEGQKKAGNYKKGHIIIDGMDISIENPKGSIRTGEDENGNSWGVRMNNTYGYIRGTEGVDGDHIDIFLSDNLDEWNGNVYVVDQVKEDGTFDEHKVMYGFNSAEEAKAAYLSNYTSDWKGFGAITEVSKDEFKKWLESSHKKTKPFAEYKNVKKKEEETQKKFNELKESLKGKDDDYAEVILSSETAERALRVFESRVTQAISAYEKDRTTTNHTEFYDKYGDFTRFAGEMGFDVSRQVEQVEKWAEKAFAPDKSPAQVKFEEEQERVNSLPVKDKYSKVIKRADTIEEAVSAFQDDIDMAIGDIEEGDIDFNEGYAKVSEIEGFISHLFARCGIKGKERTALYNNYETERRLKQIQEELEKKAKKESAGTKEKDTFVPEEQQQTEQETEQESEEPELTEAEINALDVDNSIKINAIAFIRGDNSPIAQFAYQTIKNYVRNQSKASAADSKDANKPQLGETTDDVTGSQSRPSGEPSDEVDRAGSAEDVSSVSTGSEDSTERVAQPVGEGRDSNVEGEESVSGDVPSGDAQSGGSSRVRGNGSNVRKPRGQKGGSRVSKSDAKRGKETTIGKDNVDQLLQDTLDELIDKVSHPMRLPKDRFYDVTTLIAAFGTNAIEIFGLTAKVGYLLLVKGFRKFDKWKQQMYALLNGKFREKTNLTDEQMEEFINMMWEGSFEYNGEIHKVSEWAGILEQEELRKAVSMTLEEKRKMQKEAERVETKLEDLDNIKESLPFLLPAQQEDVQKAETQFFNPSHADKQHGNGKGYMFTNGTGTGKTYTGLGIVKRFVKQGKGRVLIVTASEQKINDWIDDAKNLGIKSSKLENTTSKGSGVVVTQYANIRQNFELLKDEFDLIVYDESHKLMENQEGEVTSTATFHHMLANRDVEQAITREMVNSELWQRERTIVANQNDLSTLYDKLAGDIDKLTKEERARVDELGGPVGIRRAINELGGELSQLHEKQQEELEKALQDPERIKKAQKAVDKTKVVFLSATPFNTASSLDYVEGYIFAYPSDDTSTKDDRERRKEKFLINNFGHSHTRNKSGKVRRMSEGAITDPEAASEEEIKFSDFLQDELHTMSGRMLDSTYDYSRQFPLIETPFARLFNKAVQDLEDGGKYSILKDFFRNIFNNYPEMTALFESIKTAGVIERIKEHQRLGRKVVVFHRRMDSKQPLEPPFAKGLSFAKASDNDIVKKAAAEFAMEYEQLMRLEQTINYDFPHDQIVKAFATKEDYARYNKEVKEWNKKVDEAREKGKKEPKAPRLRASSVGLFNGTEKNSDRDLAVKSFNNDDSEQDIIVVQVQSGKEGISLHDTTGKHQRVEISLYLPQSPIEFIQAEGRIYRVGNKSNAIFEYPLLGINIELASFAAKINGRSQTSENLALGSKARGLRDSIARAALASKPIDVSNSQGVGGKLLDSRDSQNVTDYDTAIANYGEWANDPQPENIDDKQVPDPIGLKMTEWAMMENGESMLIPYAGVGTIARYAPTKAKLTALEKMMDKYSKLITLIGGGGRKVEPVDFKTFSTYNKFDGIVMNGCKEYEDSEDSELTNIAKAMNHIEQGGRIVSIIKNKNLTRLRTVLNPNYVITAEVSLPKFVFDENVSVAVIDKVDNADLRKTMPDKQIVDLSEAKDMNDLFTQLRDISVPARTIDKVARIRKRLGKYVKDIEKSNLVSKSKNYGTGKMQKDVSLDGYHMYVALRQHTFRMPRPMYGDNYRSFELRLDYIANNNLGYIQEVAELWAYLDKVTNMSEEEIRSNFYHSYSDDAIIDEIWDLASILKRATQDALGKTEMQIRNLANGVSENRISGIMNAEKFEQAFRSLNQDNETINFLADKIFDFIKKIPNLKFQAVPERKMIGGSNHNVVAHYVPGYNLVELNEDYYNSIKNSDEMKSQAIIHELIHVATSYAIEDYQQTGGMFLSEEQKEAVKDILNVYKEVNTEEFAAELRRHSKMQDNAEYGLTNEHEMMAELANPLFRAQLKAKKLWRQLVNGIKRLFGIDVLGEGGETNALKVLEDALETLLDTFDINAYNAVNRPAEYTQNQIDALRMVTGLSEKEIVDKYFKGRTFAKKVGEDEVRFREGDREYLDAVESGDMEKAKEMVMEAANNAGYINDQSYRLSHKAPTAKYGTPMTSITEMFPEDIFGPNGAFYYGNGDRYESQKAIDIIRRVQGNPDRLVKVYRAVRKDIKEGSVRNGDWVTISRDYAKEHGYRNWGKYNIIEQEVPAKFLYNDGNSIFEFGYDDEKEYGYKNTKNNRKLLDAVTYDDEGNVIPLSKRFKPRNADIRFREESFYSNAKRAVEGISQKKATPEQWLKMIQKAGGLKAGEDKWLGLSDWLNASTAKTLTKDEVLDYINANEIQMEEVDYTSAPFISENVARMYGEEFNEAFGYEENLEYPNVQVKDARKAAKLYNAYADDRIETDANGNLKNRLDIYRLEGFGQIAIEEATANKESSGRRINETRFTYTTPNLRGKKEIVLVVPNVSPFQADDEIHFGSDTDGKAIAWVRFGETTDEDGKRVLVIDEIQSNRHQEGRKRGYSKQNEKEKLNNRISEILKERKSLKEKQSEKGEEILAYFTDENGKFILDGEKAERIENDPATKPILEGLRAEYDDMLVKSDNLDKEYEDLSRRLNEIDTRGLVPDAPFEKNWMELGFKRMLRYAAENGFDKVAWTTGTQQAVRYSIGKVLSEVKVGFRDGERRVRFYQTNAESSSLATISDNGTIESATGFMSHYIGKNLDEVVGKDLTSEILSAEGEKTIKTNDMSVGGEGMKSFYDKMLPTFASKYVKKWGSKVEDVVLPKLHEADKVMHSVEVTPQMEASVMQGQPLFREGDEARQEVEADKRTLRDEAKKLGADIEILDTPAGLEGKFRRAKGWFNTRTKKVTIVLSNNRNLDDAMSTIFHEIVGHKGLRELFGDKFDKFLMDVFRYAPKNLRQEIFRNSKRTKWNAAVATDEYLARLAEDGQFKKAGTWWNKIKYLFKSMLRSAGIKFRFSDNELRYILWRSYKNLESGARDAGVMNLAEDIAMQARLNVGNFGDIRYSTSEQLFKKYPNWLSGQTTGTGQHTTQITSTVNTYKKIGEWLINNGMDSASILDASSGLGKGTEALREMGFDVDDVEPYPSENRNAPTFTDYNDIDREYDIVISNAVLNVIPEDWRENILLSMADKVKTGGKMIINVRDAKEMEKQKQKIELDDSSEILVTDKAGNIRAYQKGFTQSELEEWIKAELGEGWKVERANKANSGLSGARAVVVTNEGGGTRFRPSSSISRKQGQERIVDVRDTEDGYIAEDMSGVYRSIPALLDAYRERHQGESVTLDESGDTPRFIVTPEDYGGISEKSPFATREKERAIKRTTELADKLGVKVNFIDNLDDVPAEYEDSKGWIDEDTDEVNIVLPNNYSADDCKRTLLFNAVGRYGLRKFFGEKYDEFLNLAYDSAVRTVQERINNMSESEGLTTEQATEKYIASLAEDENFEKPENQDWWRKLWEYFVRYFEDLFDDFVRITDNELRYILWRSYDYMTEEEGRTNPFVPAEDIRFRMADGPQGPAIDEYNEAVRKDKNMWYRLKEAYQDNMLSLSKLMKAISNETRNEIEDYENPYMAQNAMSSAIQGQWAEYKNRFITPLKDEVVKIASQIEDGLDVVNTYLMAKHGLERNEVFAQRDAQAYADKWEEKQIAKAADVFNKIKKSEDAKLRYWTEKYQEQVDNKTITSKERDEEVEKLKAIHKENIDKAQKAYEKAKDKAKKDKAKKYQDKFEELREKDYSGLTELTKIKGEGKNIKFKERAQKIVDDFEKEHKGEVDNLWKLINAATKESLKSSYHAGMITKDNYEYIKGMFEYYVPLRGWENDEAGKEYEYLDQHKMHLSPSVTKKAKGRESQADNVVATIAFNGQSSILLNNRNLMKRHLFNLVMNNDTDLARADKQWYVYDSASDTWEEAYPDKNETYEEFEERMKSLGDNAKQKRVRLNTGLHMRKAEKNEHMVPVFVNGQKYNVYIQGDPRAAQAINGLLNPDTARFLINEDITRVATSLKHFMARMFTSANPAFIFSNMARDVVWARVAVSTKEPKEYSKKYNDNIWNIFLDTANSVRGKKYGKMSTANLIRKFEDGNLDMDNEIERYFYEFIMNGGETGFVNITKVEDHKRDLRRLVRDVKQKTSDNVLLKSLYYSRKGGDAILDAIEFMNRSVEDMTRFAVYVTSREMGRSVQRSVYDAKEVTVNFNKKGAGFLGAQWANTMYVFFNAAVQSIANFTNLLRKHPAKFIKKLAQFAMLGMLLPVYSISMSMLFGGDDDNKYYDLPKWVRANNAVIWLPGNVFLTIPLSHELRPYYALGEGAMSVLMGKEDPGEALTNVALDFSAMLPLDFTGNSMDPIINLTPTYAQPLVQISRNTDFFGKPIYKKTPFNERKPEWTKAYKGTSPTLVNGARWLNEVTGGDEAKSGVLDFNPAWVEHILESYLGGAGKTINKSAKTFGSTYRWIFKDGELPELRNVPVVSSFVHGSDPRTSGSSVLDEYYNMVEEYRDMDYLLNEYNSLIRQGKTEYKEARKELLTDDFKKRHSIIDRYTTNINKMRSNLKYIPEDKRKKIQEEILKRQQEMVEKVNNLDK